MKYWIILALLFLTACSHEIVEITPEPIVTFNSTNVSNSYFPQSHFKQKIPEDAVYTPEERIGTVRQNYEAWSEPIYRVTENISLIKVVDKYTDRSEQWPIPSNAKPATESDAHMAVISIPDNKVYEFWQTEWKLGELRAGAFMEFNLSGNATSHPHYIRVNAAGWSTMAGMIIREDFNENLSINHALAVSLHRDVIEPRAFIPPAVGGERNGRDPQGIPMGTHFAIGRNADVDNITMHPLSREIARALRDYGMYVIDSNEATMYRGKHVAAVRIEVGLLEEVYGITNDQLVDTIQSDIYGIIERYGIYRIN